MAHFTSGERIMAFAIPAAAALEAAPCTVQRRSFVAPSPSYLCQSIARDGEGATKLLRCTVQGALNVS